MNRYTIVFFVLCFSVISFGQVDRTKQPNPGPAPIIELDEYSTFSLENGLKVIVVENHKLPRVTFSLVLHIDPVLQGDTAGYVSAAGQLLRTGTKTRSKDQLDEEIDFIGGNISTSSTGVFAASLKKHMNSIVELFSDVILNSEFREEELNKIILRMQSNLAQSKDDPGAIASRVANAVRYGFDHPYGEHDTEESLKNVTLEKCIEYYENNFRPNVSYLAIVGDITLKEIRPLIEKHFGNWGRKEVPKRDYYKPQAPEKTKIIFVDRPNSIQSVIDVTYPVELNLGDPEEIPSIIMNTVLGGGAFRLFNNLREKHAYTYGAYSTLRRDELIGYFSANAEVRNQVTDSALTEIFYEMNRIRNEAVEEDELAAAKNYIMGNFAISLEQPQTIARFALNILRYDLPEDYYSTYLKKIEAVTEKDVQQSAQKYIKPEHAYIVIVGSKDAVAEKLEQFGEVVFYDIYGKEIVRLVEDLGDINAEDIIRNYIVAIGGAENLKKVYDRTTILEGSVQGINVKMTSFQKTPNLLRQEIDAGGMKQIIIFDGSKGYLLTENTPKEITGSELEKLSIESEINLLLNLDEAGIQMKLAGKEVIEGNNVYKLEMNFPSGSKWIQYYDIITGIKLKEVKPVESAQGIYNQEIYFSDYREIDGIMYPFQLKQSIGQQQIDMRVINIEVNSGLSEELFKIK